MKRLLPLFLALCMVLSLFPVVVSADDTGEAPADGYYLTGTHNNWDAANLTEALRFHESYGDPDEFILETDLTQGQEFKVVKVEDGAVTTWYPDGANNNYIVDADHAGPAVIYFRDTYWNDWAANGGYVWVGGKPAVSYIDENGETQTCTDYTTANYAGGVWSGWIVVNEDLYVQARIQVEGEVHVILEDGHTLGVRAGIHVSNGNSICFYSQENGTGTVNIQLVISDYAYYKQLGNNMWSYLAAIGTNARSASVNPDGYDLTHGPIVINGGIFNLQGLMSPAIGVADSVDTGDIIINGGVVNATAERSYMTAAIGSGWSSNNLQTTGSITVNGGEVHASGLVGLGDLAGGSTRVTINGGIVETTGIGTRDDANYGTNITINGGNVTVHPNVGNGPASGTLLGNDPGRVDQTAHVAINGGQVAVEGVAGGDQCEISLGWTDPTDFIVARGYSGTVTLTDDWAVDGSDETFEAGPVEINSTLANKKLIPLIPEPVEPIETEDLHIYNSISVGTDMVITFTVRKNDLTNYNNFWIEVVKKNPEGDATFLYTPEDMTEGSSTWTVQFKNIYAKEMGVDV